MVYTGIRYIQTDEFPIPDWCNGEILGCNMITELPPKGSSCKMLNVLTCTYKILPIGFFWHSCISSTHDIVVAVVSNCLQFSLMSPATGWMWFQKAYPIRITNHSSGRSVAFFVSRRLWTKYYPLIRQIQQTSSKFIIRKPVLPGKCLLCREADGDICNGSEGEWRHEDTMGFMGIDGILYILYILYVYIYIYIYI